MACRIQHQPPHLFLFSLVFSPHIVLCSDPVNVECCLRLEFCCIRFVLQILFCSRAVVLLRLNISFRSVVGVVCI